MDPSGITGDAPHCETCQSRQAFGLFTLHTDDGEHIASWWSCAECADHDAPIHAERGLQVAVVGFIESSW